MTLYVDSSAFLKRFVDEPDRMRFVDILDSADSWTTCRISWTEVWRGIGVRLNPSDAITARAGLRAEWQHMSVVEVDATLAESAGHLADVTRTKTLDALHLAAAQRAGAPALAFVTADVRQAQAARSLGWTVLGV